MGTISKRTLSDGTLRYRAEIRINRKEYPVYKESKTFSTNKLAEKWLKKRELEIEANPNVLHSIKANTPLTLSNAIDLYLDEVGGVYTKSKVNTLKLIKRFPIGKKKLSHLCATDLSDHVALRNTYCPKVKVGPISPSTILQELLQIRTVITHASIMWDAEVNIQVFDKTTAQLRKTRKISASLSRDRLPTNDELKRLILFFYDKWTLKKYTRYPMHLICMLAITSCRRQAEITRLEFRDFEKEFNTWQVRDIKNPNGSKGNHKSFIVSDDCQKVIDLLMQPDVRKRFKSKTEGVYLVPLRSQTLATEFHHACNALGIENLRFHDLRHEGCTQLAEKGLTVPQIQQYSLHSSWQSLQRYVSLKKRKAPLTIDEMLHLINEM